MKLLILALPICSAKTVAYRQSGTTGFRPQAGFTLLEVLLVVAIMAILVGLATLSGGDRTNQLLRQQTTQLMQLLEAQRDQVVISGRPKGLLVERGGYRLLSWDGTAKQWQPSGKAYQLPEPLQLVDNLNHGVVEIGGASALLSRGKSPQQRQLQPAVIILPGGELSTFSLTLSAPGTAHKSIVAGGGYTQVYRETN